ncbi:MAG: ABC transporter permease, partial [Planctomycetaceae bacterium]|nr:ABC transporter permease [Planctomycetaceae bacterium]
LLFAALSWTIIGTVSLMPGIYDTPSAPRMLLGYYFVLALPMLLVVPLAAYRSLEGEIDDGTLELLSITALSPKQIVLGKLASAMLQMLLYFVVLFPCVSYAYTLRGVDFPTTVVLLGMLVLAGILMTIVALFFAPLSQSRTGRVTMLLVVIAILVGAEWFLGVAAYELIFNNNGWLQRWGFYEASIVFGGVLLIVPAVAYLLLTLTAAQLTPVIENRSTKIRVSLLVINATVAAWIALGFEDEYGALAQITLGGTGLMLLWV